MYRHIACLLFALTISVGCSDSSVELVKNGTMFEYPNTTVGKAFEASFADAKWETKTTEKGVTTVHFKGAITQRTHDYAAAYLVDRFKGINFDEDSTPVRNAISFARSILVQYMGESEFKSQTYDAHAALEAAMTNARADWNPDTEKVVREAQKALDIATANCYLVFIASEFWPIGSPVEFVWTISQDKKSFELASFSNDSWARFDLKPEHVIKTIYSE